MNLVIPRFFCRVLCPLGATLGVLSRFALWRIERDPNKCTDCDLCRRIAKGRATRDGQLRKSECFVCFNCIEDCPHDALSFAALPPRSARSPGRTASRRRAILAVVGRGAVLSRSPSCPGKPREISRPRRSARRARVEEQEFLERCIKCDQCIRVCPTNVLQPAMLEAGLEGVWTPVMNFRMGFCQLQLHGLRPGVPDRGHPAADHRREAGLGPFATSRAGPAGHRPLRPRPLPAVVEEHPVRGVRGGLPDLAQGDPHRVAAAARPRRQEDGRLRHAA